MSDFPLTPVDLAVFAVLLLSAVLAFFRGFVKEVLSVGAWIGAALATLYGFGYVQPHMRDLISIPLAADAVAALAIFVVTLIVLSVFTHWIAGYVRDSSFSAADRGLGFFFGIARGALVVCLAWLLFAWAVEEEGRPDYILEARTLPLVKRGATFLTDLVPAEFREQGTVMADEAGRSARETLDREIDDRMGSEAGDDDATGPSEPGDGAATDTPTSGYGAAPRQQMDELIEQRE